MQNVPAPPPEPQNGNRPHREITVEERPKVTSVVGSDTIRLSPLLANGYGVQTVVEGCFSNKK